MGREEEEEEKEEKALAPLLEFLRVVYGDLTAVVENHVCLVRLMSTQQVGGGGGGGGGGSVLVTSLWREIQEYVQEVLHDHIRSEDTQFYLSPDAMQVNPPNHPPTLLPPSSSSTITYGQWSQFYLSPDAMQVFHPPTHPPTHLNQTNRLLLHLLDSPTHPPTGGRPHQQGRPRQKPLCAEEQVASSLPPKPCSSPPQPPPPLLPPP